MAEEQLDPPKYILVQSLRDELKRLASMSERVLLRLKSVYPVEDDNDAELTITQIGDLTDRLASSDLDLLPEILVVDMSKASREVHRDLRELELQAGSGPTDLQAISNLLGSLNERFDNLLGHLQRWLPYLLLRQMPNNEIERVNRSLRSLEEAQNKQLAEIENSIQAAVVRATDAASSIERKDKIAAEALGDIGVSKHAEKFKEVQDEHANAAKRWFAGSVALIALTMVVAYLLYSYVTVDGGWDSPANVHKIVFKIAVLTTLFYLISQAVKNYRINKHLEVVNRHRATALRTFRTFVENAGENKEIREAILLETTKTIFAPASTGYTAGEDDNPHSKIIELVNVIKGK